MELTPQEQKLAIELAQTLDDIASLLTYQKFVKQYAESYLRERLNLVMKIPKEDIKKTRGAYFTYLVLQHEKSKRNYPRN
jgi:hypothetical protein